MRIRHKYRTDYLIRQAEREYWAEQLGYIGRLLLRAVWRGLYEALRFLAVVAGTSLFTFVAVPIMEMHPDFIRAATELLAVLVFGLWLGAKIYGNERKGR